MNQITGNVLVIESHNFFDDPDLVRERAMGFDYEGASKKNGTYPGRRTDHLAYLWPEMFEYIHTKICDTIGLDKDNYVTESFIQYCLKNDGNSWVHRDTTSRANYVYAAVIYLTPEPEENSGTILYEHNTNHPLKNYYDIVTNGSNNTKDNNHPIYESLSSIFRLSNEYNKAVIYDTEILHKSDNYFGNDLSDSRLFAVAFVREK